MYTDKELSKYNVLTTFENGFIYITEDGKLRYKNESGKDSYLKNLTEKKIYHNWK